MMDTITLLTVSGLAAWLIGGGLYQLAYHRGFKSSTAIYEPLLHQRQLQINGLDDKIRHQRHEHEARWLDATAMIEHLQQQVDANATLQSEHQSHLMRAANLLSNASKLYSAAMLTLDARNATACAEHLRRIANTLQQDQQPAPTAAPATTKDCECQDGGCSSPCVKVEAPA
jgi:hypothetical protein